MTSSLSGMSDADLMALYSKSQAPASPLGKMSDEELQAAYQKTQPDQTTWYERGARGVRDVVEGAGQLGARMPMPFVLNREKVNALPGKVDQEVKASGQDYTARRGENAGNFDWMRAGGNMLATAPLALAAPVGATMGGAIASGALTGAATGALQPVTENQENFWTEKAKETGLGAATGGIGGGIIHGASRILSPTVSPEVKMLMDKGVTPTPGQLLGGIAKKAEDLTGMGQRGVTQEFNIAAVNDALAPLGITLPKGIGAGHAAVTEANNAVRAAYDDVWSGARKVGLDKKAADEIDNILGEASRKLKGDALTQFETLMQDATSGVKGAVTADKMRAAVTELRQHATDFGPGRGVESMMGRLYGRLADTLEGAAVRTNPELAAAKSAADKAYAGMSRINNAAAKDIADGVFSPAQLAASVKSGAGAKQAAQGTGLLQDIAGAGMKVLGPGNSGVVGAALPLALGGAGMGASALTSDPSYAALGMGAAGLYTPTGRRLAASALAGRQGAQAKAMAEALRNMGPYVAGGAANLGANFPNQNPQVKRVDAYGRTI